MLLVEEQECQNRATPFNSLRKNNEDLEEWPLFWGKQPGCQLLTSCPSTVATESRTIRKTAMANSGGATGRVMTNGYGATGSVQSAET